MLKSPFRVTIVKSVIYLFLDHDFKETYIKILADFFLLGDLPGIWHGKAAQLRKAHVMYTIYAFLYADSGCGYNSCLENSNSNIFDRHVLYVLLGLYSVVWIIKVSGVLEVYVGNKFNFAYLQSDFGHHSDVQISARWICVFQFRGFMCLKGALGSTCMFSETSLWGRINTALTNKFSPVKIHLLFFSSYFHSFFFLLHQKHYFKMESKKKKV